MEDTFEGKTSGEKPINIVLDLNYVFIQNILPYEEKEINKYLDEAYILKVLNESYFVYPGWREFLKAVISVTEGRLIFFSNKDKERNEKIIWILMKRFLGYDPSKFIKNHVTVYSRKDTIDTKSLAQENQRIINPLGMYGEYKKDLNIGIKSYDNLKNTIWIDADYSSVIRGQESNLLLVDGDRPCFQYMKRFKPDKMTSAINVYPDQCCFFTYNKLFYAAGVLVDVLRKSLRERKDLTDILYRNHGCRASYCITRRIEYYSSGYSWLSSFNPDVHFIINEQKNY